MAIDKITYDNLPEAIQLLLEKVTGIEQKLNGSGITMPEDGWFNLDELCAYLPDHPTSKTVYSWVHNGRIPYHKTGKCLRFRKSEIDEWLGRDKIDSADEISQKATQFINNKHKKNYGTKN